MKSLVTFADSLSVPASNSHLLNISAIKAIMFYKLLLLKLIVGAIILGAYVPTKASQFPLTLLTEPLEPFMT